METFIKIKDLNDKTHYAITFCDDIMITFLCNGNRHIRNLIHIKAELDRLYIPYSTENRIAVHLETNGMPQWI